MKVLFYLYWTIRYLLLLFALLNIHLQLLVCLTKVWITKKKESIMMIITQ